MFPLQSSRFIQGVNPWNDSSGCIETIDYVLNRLGDVVRGKVLDQSQPPPLDLCYSHVIQVTLYPLRKSLGAHVRNRHQAQHL